MKKVIIAGASGLIGSELLTLLLNNKGIEEVIALLRKPLPISHNKLRQITVNFENLASYKSELNGDVIYCCLGSTIKKTPKLADYLKVDHDYPVELAKIALKNKIEQFHLISALGANSSSKVFYTRLKGETEEDLKALGLKSLHIYQPALLTGNRSEHRSLEKLFGVAMKVINPLLLGPLEKYRSIKATTVAQAMINQTFKTMNGLNTYSSDIIKTLA
ncbi:MAG: NAD(P)H-binding protein [Sphingobacteriaceae bacterium]|nr:NAD(P)H-binding protein [Sphingobacteriaceae bacterium]